IGAYGYYLQAALYTKGANLLGVDIDHFIFVAVEENPPAVAVYRITDEALMAGEHELYELMKVYKECRETGRWPGYPEEIQDISVPYWVLSNIEERTGVEL